VRQIGTLPRNLDPRIFGDYLLSLGMKTRVDDRPEGWLVWVHNEDHFERAKQELSAYLGAPDDPRYGRAAEVADAVRRKEAKLEREFRKNFRYVTDEWSGIRFRRRPLTMSLVIASVVVFILQQFADDGRPRHGAFHNNVENTLAMTRVHFDPEHGLRDDGMDPIRSGQVWRLVTPIFLHFGILHIVFNCWAVALEGTLIETRKGTLRLAALVLASAILSNLGQYFYMDRFHPDGLHLFGGLSGVAYALFGYLWMKGQYEPEEGMILHPNTITMMLFWLVLCMTGAVGSIANAAHVTGLLVGVAFGAMRF
jgi:GlpG protein